MTAATAPKHFLADLARFDKYFAETGAIIDTPDGLFLDATKATSHMMGTYKALISHGYANGWL